MTIDKEKLKALAERVATDRRFCSDEHHRELAAGVAALFAEIDQLKLALDMESAELAWSDSDGREQGAENAKLRAELAGLRTGYDAQNQVIAGLRKDAERYRWLRSTESWQDSQSNERGESIVNARDDVTNADGDYLDRAVDAAMAKAASHD